MPQARRIPDPVLMVISILVIVGFQGYWLRNSYTREAKSLEIRTNMAFQETVRQQQAVKLRINNRWIDADSLHPDRTQRMDIVRNMGEGPFPGIDLRGREKEDLVTTVNVIQEKIKDSLRAFNKSKRAMIVSMNGEAAYFNSDSDRPTSHVRQADPGTRFFQFLYEVDSLQDSIRVQDLSVAYKSRIKKDKIDVPFSILKKDLVTKSSEPVFNEAVVGFRKPVSYQLILGNTFPYLLKKITLPILFSIFLIGVTILSFVILYRSVLKQQRLADIKNEFISNITHELKTPIATVGVAIEALKNFSAINDPARTREYLDISSNELQRLSLLVDKVLKLSMFEKKEIEVNYQPVNIGDITKEVLTSMRLQFEKYHATVSTHYEGDLRVKADRLHILSVVFNLLDNALKYGGESPVVDIRLSGNESGVQLSIRDHGIGIEPAYRDKIFEKFFRVPAAGNTHNAKGHGLGLSYAAEVIRQHKGTISLESHPGTGSTFTLTLPKDIA